MENLDLTIHLHPEAEDGGEFHTPNRKFPRTFFQSDYGDSLMAKATTVGITHGTLDPEDGEPATLLVIEFRFISMKQARRFTNCAITLTFEDASGDPELAPEVHRISPEGQCGLNKTTKVRNVKDTGNLGINAGFAGVGGDLGYVWEKEESDSSAHWASLSGLSKEFGGNDKDDGVIWSMEENRAEKSGIPSFLRTAVLLCREIQSPVFNFRVDVRAEVDFSLTDIGAGLRTLTGWGSVKIDRIVEIDTAVSPKQLRVSTLDPQVVDLTRMGKLELEKLVDVTFITMLG